MIGSVREELYVEQIWTHRNNGVISRVHGAFHGLFLLALQVSIGGCFAMSKGLIKGTTLDFAFFLALQLPVLTDPNQVNGP